MIKKTFKNHFVMVGVLLLALVAFGIIIGFLGETEKRIWAPIYSTISPFCISILAVWLSYCIQKRSAYLQQLRSLWTRLIDSVHTALQYTELTKPSREEYLEALFKMSTAIDEVRGLFRNLSESDTDNGLYPFEPLKNIYFLIEELQFSRKFSLGKAKKIGCKIRELWKDVRRELLKEFDREEPVHYHSHWIDVAKNKV